MPRSAGIFEASVFMQKTLLNLIRAKSCCRLLQTGVLLLVILLAIPPCAIPGGAASSEYNVKAALLYKLTNFIEWPAPSGGVQPEHFNICLLGRDDFGIALDSLNARKVNDTPIVVHRFAHSKGINKQCQLLFISDSKKPFLASIIHALGSQPVLTIGDAINFAESGGMIQFVSEKKRIGFKINLQKAQAANLKISAPLLELATIISTEKHQDKP